MPLTLRKDKNAPLTTEELDTNFKELHDRVTALEQGTLVAEGLKKVTLEGSDLVFLSTFGQELGRFALPIPPLQARGRWAAQQKYCQGDIVTHHGQAFLCFKNSEGSTSQGATGPDLHSWQLILDGKTLTQERSESDSGPQEKSPQRPDLSRGSVPLYEGETLPKPALGQLGILLGQGGAAQLVYATGQKWQSVAIK